MGKWWKGWEGHRVGMVEVDKVRRKGKSPDAILCHDNAIIQQHMMTMS